LETGQLDAIAAYKHEAIAKGLSYITLPPQINLANPTYSHLYKKASYTLDTDQTVYGEPIYFSVTIPEMTVSNLNGAISFVRFLLSTDGEHILQSQGLNYIKPTTEGKVDKLPFPLRSIIMTQQQQHINKQELSEPIIISGSLAATTQNDRTS
jgi:molybdate/tungstate transport system substrate-binding protein